MIYAVKRQIYLQFDKTQKTALCNFLRALTKQNPNLEVLSLYEKFIEDEKYYLEINSSRFEFIKDFIYEDTFKNDTILYLTECKKYYEYKQSQDYLVKKQKEFLKQKKVFLNDVKMSKEKPTKKQLYYYDKLCQKYNIEKLDINNLSKLDLKREIGKILDEHK